MSCANKALMVILLLIPVGLWGCGQQPSHHAAVKIRDLEARNVKLEEDYRSSVQDCVEVRKKLADVEEQAVQLARQAEQLRAVAQERDRLRQQVTAATSDRNALHAQMQQFSRELQNLAGKVDAAATGTSSPSVTSSTSVSLPGQS